MPWLIFQGLIIFAVVASNIHWHWTPNRYLAGGLGVLAAYLLTRLVSWVASKVRAA